MNKKNPLRDRGGPIYDEKGSNVISLKEKKDKEQEEFNQKVEELSKTLPFVCVYVSDGMYLDVAVAEALGMDWDEDTLIPCSASEMEDEE